MVSDERGNSLQEHNCQRKAARNRGFFLCGNTIRYFMAVEAFLAELHAPAQAQLEQRLAEWRAGMGGYRHAPAKKSNE